VFQKDGPLKQVWKNGVKLLDGGGQLALPTDIQEFWIGSERGANSAHGYIDEFAVFDSALTEGQIAELAGGKPAIELVIPPVELAIIEINATRGEGLITALEITFASNKGIPYAVDHKATLNQEFWEELDDNVIGTEMTTIWQDNDAGRLAQPNGFYRFRTPF
jgi:hypothetical protein